MIRRRTAIGVSAVALLATTPLLTACGSDAHPGAAAVVEGERITVSQLQAQVRDVRDAQEASSQSAELIAGTAQLGRATLNSMIFDRVLAKAAKDAGITVSRRDVQQARAEAERAAGGSGKLRRMWLEQYAIAPARIDSTLRTQVAMDRLSRKIGADRSTPEGQAKIIKALGDASSGMSIGVNPRYGKWDAEQVRLGGSEEPWLRPANPQGGGGSGLSTG